MKFVALFLFVLFTQSCNNYIEPIESDLKKSVNPIGPCPESPNCFRVTQYFQTDSSTIFEALKKSVSQTGSKETSVEIESHIITIQAIYRIPVFGWLDDVIIKIESDPSYSGRSIVYLKSSSREGYYDLGVNKRRINRILKKAHKELN